MKTQNFELVLMDNKVKKISILLYLAGWLLLFVFILLGAKVWYDAQWYGYLLIYSIIGITFLIFFHFLVVQLQILNGIYQNISKNSE